mgnify:CR=1 FL=1
MGSLRLTVAPDLTPASLCSAPPLRNGEGAGG